MRLVRVVAFLLHAGRMSVIDCGQTAELFLPAPGFIGYSCLARRGARAKAPLTCQQCWKLLLGQMLLLGDPHAFIHALTHTHILFQHRKLSVYRIPDGHPAIRFSSLHKCASFEILNEPQVFLLWRGWLISNMLLICILKSRINFCFPLMIFALFSVKVLITTVGEVIRCAVL